MTKARTPTEIASEVAAVRNDAAFMAQAREFIARDRALLQRLVR